MKKIGLLGGMSWQSTVSYYTIINQCVHQQLGGFHSAELFLYSVNFQQIEEMQRNNQWDDIAQILSDASKKLESLGCDFLVICCNTVHKIYSYMQKHSNIPILHIVDAMGHKLSSLEHQRVGMVGTASLIQGDVYQEILQEKFSIHTIIPTETQIQEINDIIYKELCFGKVLEPSKLKLQTITEYFKTQDADAVILACTELDFLTKDMQYPLPIFDSTTVHAEYAVQFALTP